MATLDLGQVVAPDCLSAYEAAVAGGYIGSEESFQLKLGSLLTIDDVVDNLTSTSAADALSANQGRVLQESLSEKADASQRKLQTYTSLSDIGITVGTETMESIAEAMPIMSSLSILTDSRNNGALDGSAYPVDGNTSLRYGLLIVTKTANHRVVFQFFYSNMAFYRIKGALDGMDAWKTIATATPVAEVELELNTGVTAASNAGNLFWKDQEGVVTVSIAAAFSKNTSVTIGTLPPGYRPVRTVYGVAEIYNYNSTHLRAAATLQVTVSGVVTIVQVVYTDATSCEAYGQISFKAVN